MLFQMRCYWSKSIGWSIGKYRTEYRELNLLFLNHNFSILPDTRIGPYRGVSAYRAVSDTGTAPILKYRWFLATAWFMPLGFWVWRTGSSAALLPSGLPWCRPWGPAGVHWEAREGGSEQAHEHHLDGSLYQVSCPGVWEGLQGKVPSLHIGR